MVYEAFKPCLEVFLYIHGGKVLLFLNGYAIMIYVCIYIGES